MTHNKNRSIKNGPKKLYLIGIVLISGFLLLSADNCEEMYMKEQQEFARLQAAKDQEQRAREQQELERRAAAGSGQQTQDSTAQKTQPASGTGSTGQQAQGGRTQGTQPASGTGSTQPASGTGSTGSGQQAQGGTTQGTQPASGTGTTQPASGTGSTGSGQQAQGGTTQPASGTGSTQPASGTAGQGTVTGSTGANYLTSISGKSWKLVELRFVDRTVTLNRSELSADQADIFTLNIDNEKVSGKAAPNRYMTSYQAGANNTLTIRPIASTMMALIVTDPQKISEPQYLQYLGKVKSWNINQNRLELTSADAANQTVIMVFSN